MVAVAAGAVVLVSASAGSSTIGPGGLTQLASPDDCISEGLDSSGCGTTTGKGLVGATWPAVSPDGKNVYVASTGNPGAVATFARAGNGSLSELGCVATVDGECGTSAAGLGFATSVAVSPDGKSVYVTGADDDTVMIFERSATDGTLTYAGCVQDAAARFDRGCATRVHGMANAYDVAVSPDGKNVYVAAGGAGDELGAVVELARGSDGSLSQLASPNDCIEEHGAAVAVCGTTTGTGLLAATALALSPDGTSLYAVADTHAVQAGDAPGALAVFSRDTTTGALTETACVGESTAVTGITECQGATAAGLSDLVNVAVSPDGKSVYTASDDPTAPIAEFARATDGSLTSLGCIDSGGAICGTTAPGLAAAFGIAVSPGGSNVYVTSAGSSSYGGAVPVAPGLVELSRAADGTLSASDCVQQAGAASQTCPTTGHGLGDALGVAVSPDGANVYVATSSSTGAVAAFARGGGGSGAVAGPVSTARSGVAVAPSSVPADGSASATVTVTLEDSSGNPVPGIEVSAPPSSGHATSSPSIATTDAGGRAAFTVTDATAESALFVATDVTDSLQIGTVTVDFTTVGPANEPPTAGFTSAVSGLTADVEASASHDPDGTIASYAWDFGDGASGSGPKASHMYAHAGTYTVALTVADDAGATATATAVVTVTAPAVNTPPTATFAVSANHLTASFDASASSDPDGSITAFAWSFGDGTTGAGALATHTYARSGTYTVVLTVTDDKGASATSAATATVAPPSSTTPVPQPQPQPVTSAHVDVPPRARVAVSPASGDKRTSFVFGSDGSIGKLTSYAWAFGDGATASGPDVTHAYGRAGSFTATLTITDSAGRTSTAQAQVSVTNARPVPIFAYHARAGRSVSFDGTPSFDPDGRVRVYRWTFGDGAVAVGPANVVHRYRGTKTRYTVALEVVDDSGARVHIRRSVSVRAGAGDVTDVEPILVADGPELKPPGAVNVAEQVTVADGVPGLIPPSSITVIETIGASDGTSPIHHPSRRRLSSQQPRRDR